MILSGTILFTGIVGTIGYIILLLALLVSGRRTATHSYLMYLAVTMIAEPFVSPAFQMFFIFDKFDIDIKLAYFLTVLYYTLISNMLTVLMLLFLIDYFRWIYNYKWTVITIHFIITIVYIVCYYCVIHLTQTLKNPISFFVLIQFCGFVLLYYIHNDLECLKKRKEADDGSRLRHVLITTFFCTKVIAAIIFALENIIAIMVLGQESLGCFAFGFMHFDSVFFLIVLFKVDRQFGAGFVNFWRTCLWKQSDGMQFQTLILVVEAW